MPKRIKVKTIRFTGGEGWARDRWPVEFYSWGGADAWLFQRSVLMPEGMLGYFKTDFRIEFEDGEVYTGRYDLESHTYGKYPDLSKHVREYIRFYAGDFCPDHMLEAQYRAHLDNQPDGQQKQFAEWFNAYDLQQGDKEITR